MTDARDPPRDYIGVGFHVLKPERGTVFQEELHLEAEPDDFDVDWHEESDGDVVVVRLSDDERSAEVGLVMDAARWDTLVDAVDESREAIDDR